MLSCLQDRKEKDSFFNWFYFAINLGSFLAVTTLVYVQESVSWTIGFAIPAVAMLLAVVTFVAGSSKYVHVEPTERYVTHLQLGDQTVTQNGWVCSFVSCIAKHMSSTCIRQCCMAWRSLEAAWLADCIHKSPESRLIVLHLLSVYTALCYAAFSFHHYAANVMLPVLSN